VTLLNDLGLLGRVRDRGGQVCYTATRIGHNHPLICGVCRRVIDFDGDGDLAYLEKQLERDTGFTVYGHHLEVYGVCADCRDHGHS
jgi:Fe2+ or Zn2+ uptake regulation protein